MESNGHQRAADFREVMNERKHQKLQLQQAAKYDVPLIIAHIGNRIHGRSKNVFAHDNATVELLDALYEKLHNFQKFMLEIASDEKLIGENSYKILAILKNVDAAMLWQEYQTMLTAYKRCNFGEYAKTNVVSHAMKRLHRLMITMKPAGCD